jgi:hypothetical protein
MANTIRLGRPKSEENLALTFYLIQFGEVPEKFCKTKGGGARGGKGGGGVDVPMCPYYGKDTSSEELAQLWALLDWSVCTQDDKRLHFTLDPIQDTDIVQFVNTENPDAILNTSKCWEHFLTLTPEFVNKGLTLKSAMHNFEDYPDPELAKAVKEWKHPTINFMLLTRDQLKHLEASGKLLEAMKVQAEMNESGTTQAWFLDPDDTFWLDVNGTGDKLLHKSSHADTVTFMFEGKVTDVQIDRNSAKSLVRFKREQTVSAEKGIDHTFKYCTNPTTDHALPMHVTSEGKKLTQYWMHAFNLFTGKKQEERTVFDDLHKCGICLDTNTQFSVLACNHAVCATCKDNIVGKKNNVTCPFCRDESSASNIVTVDVPVDLTVDLTGD